MRFGPVPLAQAVGAVLAHRAKGADRTLKKGHTLSEADVSDLSAAGVSEVTVAALDAGDVDEDTAAARLAETVAGEGVRVGRADTGRANLFAEANGLVRIDAAGVDRLNAVDPALTLGTLAPFRRVAAGQMIATVKVIPFAVPSATLEAACGAAGGPLASVAPFAVTRVAAVSTLLPTLKRAVVDKTVRILAGRLHETGAGIVHEAAVEHAVEPLAAALGEALVKAEAVVVFGASAVVDEADVIPSAIRAAGGSITRFGMPVDPGNLLVLGEIDGRVVIGAPGCARSPKENGFDFVLDRALAGVPVSSADIAGMGVGGLLTETASRPRPRDPRSRPRMGALVLAAGRSSRMGTNKLVELVRGKPMVRHAVEAALASRAERTVVVTGHEPERVERALDGLDVELVHNPRYGEGLSTSLRTGLRALGEEVGGAIVLLGDMPLVTAADCDRLLAALDEPDVLVAMALADGVRGNPVAWSSRLFAELMATEGDAGGRALLSRYGDQIRGVEIGPAAALDADTPDALAEVRERIGR